jgi:hypothetical protein
MHLCVRCRASSMAPSHLNAPLLCVLLSSVGAIVATRHIVHYRRPIHLYPSNPTPPSLSHLFTPPSICRPFSDVSPHATLPFLPRPVIGVSTELSLACLAALPRYQTFCESCAVAPYSCLHRSLVLQVYLRLDLAPFHSQPPSV